VCNARVAAGFTLMELLVVLAILGLALALSVPAFYRVLPGLELRAGAHTVAAAMREARGLAIGSNAEVVMLIDLDKHALSVGGGPSVQVDPRLGITLITATREIIDSGAGGIRFYPDGTSTGGGITLSLNQRQYHVVVDWLTGHVTVGE
jgi:general secretion pathway protein H